METCKLDILKKLKSDILHSTSHCVDYLLSDDVEKIYSIHQDHLIWASDDEKENATNCWTADDANVPIWSVNKDTMEKAEISESNYSIDC